MSSNPFTPLRRVTAVPITAALVFALLGCGAQEDPTTARAKTVFQETMAADPQYAAYALSIASDSPSPWVRQQIIDAAAGQDYATALEAVKALGDPPPAEAREALAAVFESGRGALKLQAALGLSWLDDEAALGWLKQQVEGGGAVLGLPTARLLDSKGEDELVRQLLSAQMQSESLVGRNEAYLVLGGLGRPWATQMLVQGLGNEHGEDRQQAILSLGQTGDPAVADEIAPFVNTQGLVFASLEALGALGNTNAVGSVKAMAKHEEKTVRVYAAAAAWKLGESELAIEVLQPLIEDEDPQIRRVAAEQLGTLEASEAREWLGRLVQDPEKSVRLTAIREIAADAQASDAALLLSAATDTDYEVATVAMNGLSRVAGEDAVPTLEPLMEDDNPYVALCAAHAVLAIRAGAETPAG